MKTILIIRTLDRWTELGQVQTCTTEEGDGGMAGPDVGSQKVRQDMELKWSTFEEVDLLTNLGIQFLLLI